MPSYPFVCPKGHTLDVVASMKDAPKAARCSCGKRARRVYTPPLVHVDGEHSGYYPPDSGFPVDPKNPRKRICPARAKARDAFARLNESTQGGMSYE